METQLIISIIVIVVSILFVIFSILRLQKAIRLAHSRTLKKHIEKECKTLSNIIFIIALVFILSTILLLNEDISSEGNYSLFLVTTVVAVLSTIFSITLAYKFQNKIH